MNTEPLRVLAVAAHPDDIEFMMAGTLLLLKDAGAEIHMWNLANGCMGTVSHSYDEIIRLRWDEAQASASLAGATLYPPLVDDLAVYYAPTLIARVASVVRQVKPTIVLTHSPEDYMEDHTNTSRIAVTAAFTRIMKNYATTPPADPYSGDVAVYHALPHGLRDAMRRLIRAGQYVDITTNLDVKREMLACHKTQKEWLDATQGMDSYLLEMEQMSATVGEMSGRFQYAEGWRRHSHLGFSAAGFDPLTEALGNLCWIDPVYEASLNGN